MALQGEAGGILEAVAVAEAVETVAAVAGAMVEVEEISEAGAGVTLGGVVAGVAAEEILEAEVEAGAGGEVHSSLFVEAQFASRHPSIIYNGAHGDMMSVASRHRWPMS